MPNAQAEIGFTIKGICKPAASSPTTLDRMTILRIPQLIPRIR